MHLERNVYSVLDRSARSFYADEPAFGFEGEFRTFRELRDRARAVACGLAANGVRPGDRVAVMMGNRLEWAEVFFGLAALGAVCVPVNVLLVGPEVEHVCQDSGATFLVMDEVGSDSVAQLSHSFDLVVRVGQARVPDGARAVDYADLCAVDRCAVDRCDVDLGDVAATDCRIVGPDLADTFILYYSSGTTGLPKAAEHTHAGVMWNAFGQVPGLGLTRDVRYAVIPSLSWAAGFHILTLALVWIGGFSQIRRTGGGSSDDIVSLLVRERITHVMLVPSLLRDLVTRPDLLAALNDSPLQWIITGSEPVPRQIIEECVRALPDVAVVQGYGLSEFPAVATVLTAAQTVDHDGSAGRPLPHTDVAVRGEAGDIRFAGRGELLIRSAATMKGYHGRPEQTDAAFRDGWLNTGDLVDLDAEGFITVVGRTKDLIISGGLNVYPKEIEDLLHRIPGVVEAAVVGIPHERFGETPVALIVTDDPDFDGNEALRVCGEQLASYKRPRAVLLRQERLPRNANQKILKREIRPWAEKEMARLRSGLA